MIPETHPHLRAFIREAECIGCLKCIKACPFDSILGSGKQMHTVIADECTGCQLCVEPCPVDCIDMIAVPENEQKNKSEYFQKRFDAHEKRLLNEKKPQRVNVLIDRKNYIQAALARVKEKKRITTSSTNSTNIPRTPTYKSKNSLANL